jgi:hypothetical protein
MARQAPLGARPNWDVAPWFSKGDARQGFTGPRRPGRSREPSSNGRSRGMIVASPARAAAQNPAYRPSDPFFPRPSAFPAQAGIQTLSLGRIYTPPLPTLSPSRGERAFPLPRLRRYFPQRGKICTSMIFPPWGKWRAAPKGVLFSFAHLKSPKIPPKCRLVSLYPNSSRVNPVQSSSWRSSSMRGRRGVSLDL